MTLDDVRTALDANNDAALDGAVEALAGTPPLQVEAIDVVIDTLQQRKAKDAVVTGWRYALATALERAALDADATAALATAAATRATALYRDILNDGEGTTRAIVIGLQRAAEDDELLRQAVDAAGGPVPAEVLLEKAIKRAKGEDERQGRLCRALSRLSEVILRNTERAFFEGLKAARKLSYDGLVVDDVYRLALETRRLDEAAAFFQSLADEGAISPRTRATAFNKLGALLEQKGDRGAAFAAYVGSLHHFETKAARKKAERLKDDLEVSTPLPRPLEFEAPAPPAMPPPMPLPLDALHSVEASPLDAPTEERSSWLAADPNADTRLGEHILAERQRFGGFGSDEDAAFRARLVPGAKATLDDVASLLQARVDDHGSDDNVAADDIVEASDLAPPVPEDDAADAEIDVGNDVVEQASAEAAAVDEDASVLAQRYEHTVEHDDDQVLVTMTMPPAPPTALAIDEQAPRDDDTSADVPAFLAPPADVVPEPAEPVATPAPVVLVPVPDDDDDVLMPPPVAGLVPRRRSDEGEPALAITPARATKPKKSKRRGHANDSEEQTSPRQASSSLADATVPIGDVFARHKNDEDSSAAFSARSELSLPSGATVDIVSVPAEPEPEAAPFTEPPLVQVQADPTADAIAAAQRVLQAPLIDVELEPCLEALAQLQAHAPGDPRVFRLALLALRIAAPSGSLPAAAVHVVVDDGFRHGDRTVTAVLEAHRAMPASSRSAALSLWLAAARTAGHDADAVHELLEEAAGTDAVDGPAFSLLDNVLRTAGDVERRDRLHLRALRHAFNEKLTSLQILLLRRRLGLLLDAHRYKDALQVHAQLALDFVVDPITRTSARTFHAEHGTSDERARFLGKLVRTLDPQADASEAIDILQEILDVRLAIDDVAGAEATARDLLARQPDNARALSALVDLVGLDSARSAELVELLTQRANASRARGDLAGASELLQRQARLLVTLHRADDAAAARVEAARLVPGDAAVVSEIVDTLVATHRIDDALALLEQLADDAPLGHATRMLVRAAHLAREHQRLPRASALLEKAIEIDDANVVVLDELAQIQLDGGAVDDALVTLRRLVAAHTDPRARARTLLQLADLQIENGHDAEAIGALREALAGDRHLQQGWETLHTVARRTGARDVVIESLAGLAGVQQGRARAQTLARLGRVLLADNGGDLQAAATAFENALAADASDVDALGGLVIARVRALFPDADVEAAVAVPAPALVDELFPFVRNAAAAGASLPFALRRVLALGHSQKGAMPDAAVVFEGLLDEQGDDLPTLLAFARHLVHAARRGGPSAVALDQRRRDVLEAVYQHHAFALKPAVLLDVVAELCALRLAASDTPGAKKAAKKALALLTSHPELSSSLSDRAVRSFVLALDDHAEPDFDALEQALRLDVQRAVASSEKARLVEKQALLALAARNDVVAARHLLQQALQHDPELSSAREKLFDLELAGEDPRLVLERSRALLASEKDPHKKAQLHLKLFHLQRKVRGHGVADDVAVDEIRAAFELDPTNAAVREAAEKFFGDRKDARGLDELLTSQLKSLDRNDIAGRTSLLERLARLRRYETRDLRGAIDACEAHSALVPDAIKPREDAARLHSELGQWREAVSAWRAVLERDPLAVEAWRGLLSVLARSRQADEAFAVAATMAAIDIADDDIVRAVRAVRPPFPRWPIAPADTGALKKRLAHPQERSAVRAVLEVVAPRLLPRLGRPLEDFGIRRRDALAEAKLPPSVVMGVRTASTLAGFRAPVPLYLAEPGTLDATAPAFMALPASDPGLIVTADVVKGGMTPERAFALGRAITWLSPWALLSSSLDGVELRELIEGLVAGFLSNRDLERPGVDVERRGAALKVEILGGLSSTDADALVQALLPALRDWVVSRQRLQLSEWKAGVGFTGDRLGLLLAGELPAALKVIRQTGGTNAATRAAIRELVLFSVSGPALQLRRELSLALQDQGLAPILDLG